MALFWKEKSLSYNRRNTAYILQKGDNIKRYREESGAKINISDGSCPERIVTITGTTDNIHKAFTMICQKFEEVGYMLVLHAFSQFNPIALTKAKIVLTIALTKAFLSIIGLRSMHLSLRTCKKKLKSSSS